MGNLHFIAGCALNFRYIIPLIAFIAACNDAIITHTAGTLYSFTTDNGTIETASTVEVSGAKYVLQTNGTTSFGCSYTGSDAASTGATKDSTQQITSIAMAHGNVFTATYYMRIENVTYLIRKVSGPTGNIYADIRYTSGGNPTTSLGTSALVALSSFGAVVAGVNVSFTFSTPVEVPGGVDYAVVLVPYTDAVLDGSNNFRWITTSDSNGCTSYTANVFYNGGWAGGVGKSYFTITVTQYEASGQVSWMATADAVDMSWNMSTFAFSENPGGATSGTITYDIGADNNGSASYSQTGLTKAQVQALTNITGKYFYVRANLAASPIYNPAEIGSGSIQTN